MRIAVAQLGARRHYAVPRILAEAGLLERLFTDSYAGNKPWLSAGLRMMAPRFRPRAVERWLGRVEARLPPAKITSFETLGFGFALRRHRRPAADELGHLFADVGRRFNRRILAHGLGGADTVWGFNGTALELFRWAKPRGLRCILEQTILPKRLTNELLHREATDWPGWQPDLAVPLTADVIAEREAEEWQLADRIIAGSDFVVRGLVACGVDPERCVAVPYGIDLERAATTDRAEAQTGVAPHVVFVGEVGLRKGAPYLLEALRRLGRRRVKTTFAGHVAIAERELAPYRELATFLGPVPRSRMQNLYAQADLMVLPSICEGSAMATYEALVSGVPVICTPNTGSMVRDGIDGNLVRARDTEALAALLERHAAAPAERLAMRMAAREVQRDRLSLEAYGRRLVAAINGRSGCDGQ